MANLTTLSFLINCHSLPCFNCLKWWPVFHIYQRFPLVSFLRFSIWVCLSSNIFVFRAALTWSTRHAAVFLFNSRGYACTLYWSSDHQFRMRNPSQRRIWPFIFKYEQNSNIAFLFFKALFVGRGALFDFLWPQERFVYWSQRFLHK